MTKRGQQEMIGFVLIVVIVVVISLIFLVLSLKSHGKVNKSYEVDNLLGVIMRYTTGCVEQFEPQYSSFEDLIGMCYEGKKCENLKEGACEYLKKSFDEIISGLRETDPTIKDYKIKIFAKKSQKNLLDFHGNCTGEIKGAQRIVNIGPERIIVELNIC